MATPKTGILLLNMGGPARLDDVEPFLYNLFSDPDIIKLPFSSVFQKPLAFWISTTRGEEARHNYAKMGGASPIYKYSRTQGEALQTDLESRGYGKIPVYVAMRYWYPFTDEAVTQIQLDGIERLIVLPLYPHFSYTTTGSSLNELKRVLAVRKLNIDLQIINSYWDHPIYQKSVAETIQEGLDSHYWTCPKESVQILFSAHSLPQKHVKRTKDPYPAQVYESVRQIMETHFPGNEWDIAYQSKVGNMVWLGPQTDGVLQYYAAKQIENVLIVAISFVSDHVETLVEIDQLYIPVGNEIGVKQCYRSPALNTRATFIQALSALVMAELDVPEKEPTPTLPEYFQSQAV